MQGRAVAIFLTAFLAGLAFTGCEENHATTYFEGEPTPKPPAGAAAAFDAASSGSIAGRVTWEGEVPTVAPFLAPVSPLSEQPIGPKLPWPNPHAPVIDAKSTGVAGAVVFLRGVAPE